jgi:hypothetical protein
MIIRQRRMILFGRACVLFARDEKEEARRFAQQACAITAANGFVGDQRAVEQWLAKV